MPAQTLTLAGKRFVILPENEYHALANGRGKASARARAAVTKPTKPSQTRAERPHRMTKQDWGDVAEAKRRLAEPGGVTLEVLRKRLGL